MDDLWFIAYRGRFKLQITPANARGWAALIAVSLISMLPVFAIMPFAKQTSLLIVAPLLILAVIWFLFIRWALSKSEIIDIDELIAERRARTRDSKRR